MAKKPKSVQEIALEFHRNMQKIADKGGLTISVGVGDGPMKVIAEPKKKGK